MVLLVSMNIKLGRIERTSIIKKDLR